MIDKSCHALAIDHVLAVAEPEQISARMVVIKLVGLFDGDARSGIFHDGRAFFNRRGGVATFRINLGIADDQMRRTNAFSPVVSVKLAGRIFRHDWVRVLNNENSLCDKIMASDQTSDQLERLN